MVRPKSQPLPIPSQTLVLDNGGHTIKAGLINTTAPSDPSTPLPQCRIIPNAIARSRDRKVHVGAEIETNCYNYGELTYRHPMDKGCVVHWETEREIWEREFFGRGDRLKGRRWSVEPRETTVLVTETATPLAALSGAMDQMAFEYWGFAAYGRTTPGVLALRNDVQSVFEGVDEGSGPREGDAIEVDATTTTSTPSPVSEGNILVDAGFSSTMVTAYWHGKPLRSLTKRLDIGGNFLTNQMKEIVSERHYDMRAEEYTVNAIKEEVCYVTDDIKRDMESAWKPDAKEKKDIVNPVALDYVLPDWNEGRRGHSRPHVHPRNRPKQTAQNGVRPKILEEEVMVVANERFSVPELLFNPQNVGVKQAGIPGVICQVIGSLPPAIQPLFLANIVCMGGSTLFPGFLSRLRKELRMRVPEDLEIRIGMPQGKKAIAWACEGGMRLARDEPELLRETVVTKQEYEERGAQWVTKKFAGRR